METKQPVSKLPTGYLERKGKEIKKFLETNDNENMTTQNLWDCSKREVYSNTTLPQETRKTLTRQPNFTPKTTVKRRIKKKQIQN